MSYAVCRMQKVKSAGLKDMQFHNQRERKSRTNDDIDHERTRENYDLKNDKNIDYNERVKEIIESQKTGTRKTRKDAVLVNELLVTSDRDFFEQLDPGEQKRFFEESYKLFSERYGKQNIAYATVHNDEQTPHMHLGVVPMRDGKLQGKNVFNRQELLWLQDKFPEHMKKQGFELKRGERGSDRKHIETAKFKKQTLEKEIDFLEKNLAVKKDEWTAYSDKVKSDLEVPAKRHMKSVEVPTGEKSMFGLGKEIMKTEKKPTKNVVISERDYKNLVTAARDNDRLKQHVRNLMSTDMAREYKKLSKEHGQVKEKYSGLVERFNENVNDYNELLEENKSLKSKISDLKRDVSLIYESTKEFLKERTDGLKAFKNVFKGFVDKVKDKTAQFQEKHDLEPKKNEFELTHNREVKKERSRDQGMSL
ncbi:MobV family relaxase [Enterococcus faecium]|uniref:MobV family relaxase n=1 Tax=Enterococcus faecium TaxID=1352 RepID=UPI000F84C0EE|nr:MobV family relaxase [Enterococcus faecium]NTP66052.1 plasmid recombination protein [Enterococcus faecium]HAQ0351210.1 plasmid recombination protein [Enterococcus faecium]HAQ0351322.1 plasmid recombination protein [Enterococcus faecium]HAQ4548418.1 plasmid recombination protein [Enterococcus faecium]HAQ4548661.1 plasmid recombination protein [Enterococcus faecium]